MENVHFSILICFLFKIYVKDDIEISIKWCDQNLFLFWNYATFALKAQINIDRALI